jgi:hypothetical protein
MTSARLVGKRVIPFVLAVVFIVASAYKILQPGAFAEQIYNYRLLSPQLINPIAITLPWIQLLCGLALLFSRTRWTASLWVLFMLVVFQGAVASALARGLNISCGCFRAGGESATWWTFGRDTLFVALAILNLWIQRAGARR